MYYFTTLCYYLLHTMEGNCFILFLHINHTQNDIPNLQNNVICLLEFKFKHSIIFFLVIPQTYY